MLRVGSARLVRAAVAIVLGLVGSVTVATVGHASTGLAYIVCGPAVRTGYGWQTYPYGGYDGTNDGNSCRSQIDYHVTPTGGATAVYGFGTADGATYDFYAFIPSTHADVTMDFNICDAGVCHDTRVNEGDPSLQGRWVFLARVFTANGTDVTATAYSNAASIHYLGLDAMLAARQ